MKKITKNWRRKLVILKFTLQRGYAWCQLPALAIIGAGVLKPYFSGISLWLLALITFIIFITVGFIDKQIRLLHEEQSYVTEQNPTLMRGLFKEYEKRTQKGIPPKKKEKGKSKRRR